MSNEVKASANTGAAQVGSEEEPQYVYFVTNDGSSGTIQPQIVFASDVSAIEASSGAEISIQQPTPEDYSSVTDIWSRCNNALRDLLVYLVKKYRVEDVMDSKVKAQQWEKLTSEFFTFFTDQNMVSKQQIVRKWHNWKQYNKTKKKPHPFNLSPDLSVEIIREKCLKLEAELNGNTTEYVTVSSTAVASEDCSELKIPLAKLNKLRRRDFLVRRTGASASALSTKRLEHELILESLTFEEERWKIKAENQQLVKEKLTRKLELTDVKLQKARIELEILKNNLGKTVSKNE